MAAHNLQIDQGATFTSDVTVKDANATHLILQDTQQNARKT